MTVALASRGLQRDFEEFKVEYVRISQNWISLYDDIRRKKEKVDNEIENTSIKLEKIFSDLIKKIEERKEELIRTFKSKAHDVFRDFSEEYETYVGALNNIKKKNLEIDELEDLFKTSNDFDLVKENHLRSTSNLFREYCPELEEQLGGFRERFGFLQKKMNYNFSFQSTIDEDKIADFLHQHIKIKVKMSEESPQPATPAEGEEEKVANGGSPESSPSPAPAAQNTASSESVLVHRVEKLKKMLYMYDDGNFTELPFNDKALVENGEGELEETKAAFAADCRSLFAKEDQRFFLFEGTENAFSNRIFELDKERNQWVCSRTLAKARKKISALYHGGYLYFTGEFESFNTERASLERLDVGGGGGFEEIFGLNKQSSYILAHF